MIYQGFMMNAALRRSAFQPSAENDHEHCTMCGAKFSEKSGDLSEGYVTSDGAHWVCPECLNAYREEYRWTVNT